MVDSNDIRSAKLADLFKESSTLTSDQILQSQKQPITSQKQDDAASTGRFEGYSTPIRQSNQVKRISLERSRLEAKQEREDATKQTQGGRFEHVSEVQRECDRLEQILANTLNRIATLKKYPVDIDVPGKRAIEDGYIEQNRFAVNKLRSGSSTEPRKKNGFQSDLRFDGSFGVIRTAGVQDQFKTLGGIDDSGTAGGHHLG